MKVKRQKTEQRQLIANAIAYFNDRGVCPTPQEIQGRLKIVGYHREGSTVRTLLRKMVADPSSGVIQPFGWAGYSIR